MIGKVDRFSLPLDREQFRDAVQKGLGRAPMQVARFGAVDGQDIIVEACIQNQAYDPQCEDDRAEWLIGMIDAAGTENAVLPQIFQAIYYDFPGRNFWDKNQLCRLALAYAKRGRGDARKALYSALSKNDSSADIFAADEIIQLDGGDGLLHVAEKVGEWICDDPEMSSDTFLVQFYDETHGEGSAERILRSAAGHNQRIAAFLDHLNAQAEADESGLKRRQGTLMPEILERFGSNLPDQFEYMRNWTAADIIGDIEETDPSENRNRNLYRRWAIKATKSDLKRVLDALFSESDAKRQFFYLHVFQDRGLPQMDLRLLDFCERADCDNRWLVCRILAHHEHPKVRSFALERIKAGKTDGGELRLLAKNYRAGDWHTIASGLQLTSDPHEMHNLFRNLLVVYEANIVREVREPMMLLYEHSPCGGCRSDAVKLLASLNELPDWVREECCYDANVETRILGETKK